MKVRFKMNSALLNKLTDGLNEQQKQAVEMPIDSFTKVVAGAGTGKTKIISKRYIKLVHDLLEENSVEKPLEHLLVITFTQKAAAEMKERILKELKLNNINYFGQENKISTIHSFCSDILRQHAIESNLSTSFNLSEDNQLDEIYQTIIKKIQYGEFDSIDFVDDILSELNLDKEILTYESILKLKAAGSLDNIFDSVLPIIKQVKSLGLTPKEFLDKTLSAIPCYSSFLSDFLNKKYSCSHFSDIYPHEDIMAEDWCNFFRKCDYADENFKNIADKEIFGNLLDISVNKNNTRKSPKTVGWTPKFDCSDLSFVGEISNVEILLTKIIAVIYAIYQRQLEEKDLIDFDDLINKTLYILKNNHTIRAYYKKYFKHIIVDEFQDTSGAQLELLMNLLSDENPNITIVGDRKQSIYGFRYARMENLDIIQKKIEQKFSQNPNFNSDKKIKVIKLETNYRSTDDVIGVVNIMTKESLALDEPLCAFSNEKIPRSVKFTQLEKCDSADEYSVLEAKYIAGEIFDVMQRDDLHYKDFAVLVKSHGQADFLEEELSKYGIPSVKRVNSNYFSKSVVKNLTYLLEFVQNIRKETVLVKLLEINFSDKEILNLKKATDKILLGVEDAENMNFSEKILKSFELNIFPSIQCSDNIKNAVKSLYDNVLTIIKKKNTLSLTSIFYKLIEFYPPYRHLTGIAKSLADIDVAVFEKILADYSKNVHYSGIKNFLEYLKTIAADRNFEMPSVFTGEIDAVKLMTIHAAKGLEFPYTFVAGISGRRGNFEDSSVSVELNEDSCNFGLMIHKFNGKDSLKYLIYKEIYESVREAAEAKRRFYVAITRAERYLNVLVCNSPQRYLKDLIGEKNGALQHLVYPVEKASLTVENKSLNLAVPVRQAALNIVAPDLPKENTDKMKVSFSQINTFNHCKRKYLLKYVYGYPELGQKPSGMTVGSILHNLIYHSFVNGKIFNNDEILEFSKNEILEKNVYSKVASLYSSFSKSKFAKLIQKDISAEYGFEFEYKNCIFKGDIDLIVNNSDGSIDVIDFKTNENLSKVLPVYHKQMFIYKSALEEMCFNVKNLILLNIKPDGVYEFIVSESDVCIAQKNTDSDIKNLQDIFGKKLTDFPRRNDCNYCEYRYICD